MVFPFFTSSEAEHWKTLSLTHVAYPVGDNYGKFLGLFSMLPHSIMVAFFTLTIFVRDIHVIAFFAGQIANEVLNTVLKNYVAQPRPQQIAGKINTNDSYGWPSAHCQFQAFFLVYSSLCLWHRLTRVRSKVWIILLTTINVTTILLVIESRIYLRYHFVHQCVHGLLIGGLFGAIWYTIVYYFLEPFILEPLMKSKLNNFFSLCSIYLPARIYAQQRSSSGGGGGGGGGHYQNRNHHRNKASIVAANKRKLK